VYNAFIKTTKSKPKPRFFIHILQKPTISKNLETITTPKSSAMCILHNNIAAKVMQTKCIKIKVVTPFLGGTSQIATGKMWLLES